MLNIQPPYEASFIDMETRVQSLGQLYFPMSKLVAGPAESLMRSARVVVDQSGQC